MRLPCCWRSACRGLFLALPLYFLSYPRQNGLQAGSRRIEPLFSELCLFLKNRTYVHATKSMAAMTFALGGLSQWGL
jgi:hypothetical protein